MQILSIFKKDPILAGTIHLPVSKSICNRLLILRELEGRKFELSRVSEAEDTVFLIRLLERIHLQVKQLEEIAKQNRNSEITSDEIVILDCENAGTVFRFLTAFLITRPGCWMR